MKLLTLDDVKKASREQVLGWHRDFGHPMLLDLMGYLGVDRVYDTAHDSWLVDSDGNEVLDVVGGFGANSIGHNHPRLLAELGVSDMTAPSLMQASVLRFAGGVLYNLAQLAPGNLRRSFLDCTGTGAVEAAIKMARAYHYVRRTGRTALLGTHRGYHGKSYGPLGIIGKEKYQEPFRPMVPGGYVIPYDDLNALEKACKELRPIAFFVEPVQGEGGVNVPSPGYLPGVREICTRYGVLMVADEIQTGFGRTGKMFACDHYDVVPDILCTAKALGGVFQPISAITTTDEIARTAYGTLKTALLHSSTFSGITFPCKAAITTMNIIVDEGLPEQAARKGAYVLSRLHELRREHPDILEGVRGQGLLIGLQFGNFWTQALDQLPGEYGSEAIGSLVASQLLNAHGVAGVYTLNNTSVIRVEPALNIREEDLDFFLKALESALEEYRGLTTLGWQAFQRWLMRRKTTYR